MLGLPPVELSHGMPKLREQPVKPADLAQPLKGPNRMFARGIETHRVTREKQHAATLERERLQRMTPYERAQEMGAEYIGNLFPDATDAQSLQTSTEAFFAAAGVMPPERGENNDRSEYLKRCGGVLAEAVRLRLYGKMAVAPDGSEPTNKIFRAVLKGQIKQSEGVIASWVARIDAQREAHQKAKGWQATHYPNDNRIEITGNVSTEVGAALAGLAHTTETQNSASQLRSQVEDGLTALKGHVKDLPMIGKLLGGLVGGGTPLRGLIDNASGSLSDFFSDPNLNAAVAAVSEMAQGAQKSAYDNNRRIDLLRSKLSLVQRLFRHHDAKGTIDPNSYVDGILGAFTGNPDFLGTVQEYLEPSATRYLLEHPEAQMQQLMDTADLVRQYRRVRRVANFSLGLNTIPGRIGQFVAWSARRAYRQEMDAYLKPLTGQRKSRLEHTQEVAQARDRQLGKREAAVKRVSSAGSAI